MSAHLQVEIQMFANTLNLKMALRSSGQEIEDLVLQRSAEALRETVRKLQGEGVINATAFSLYEKTT